MRPTWPENAPGSPEHHYEELHPFLYSVDVFLPFVDLHQEHYWWPNSHRDGVCVFCFSMCIAAVVLAAGCSNTSSLPQAAGGSSATDTVTADPQVHEILANSCFDCHSDAASGPWNANLAPSYLFGSHKAREVLNFSNWSMLNAKQRSAAAAEIILVVASGSMPPRDYCFLHPSAKLNDEQKCLVLQWARKQTALAAH